MKKYKVCLLGNNLDFDLNIIYVKPRDGKLEYVLKVPDGGIETGMIFENKLHFKVEKDSTLNYLRHFTAAIAREVVKDVLFNRYAKTRSLKSSLISPVKFFIYPFAVSGDRSTVPDTIQIDGSMSYEQGFTSPYKGDYPSDPSAIPIPRTQTNQYLYDITNALQQYQTEGFPDFITSADNGGSPYPYDIYAVVRYNDGTATQVYQSIVGSNTDIPTVSASWRLIENGIGTNAAYVASVYMSTPTNAAGGTPTKIMFDTVNFDDVGIFDLTNKRFLPNKTGYWRLSAQVPSAMAVTSISAIINAYIYLYKNGALFLTLDGNNYTNTAISTYEAVGFGGDTIVYADGVSDYFEIYGACAGMGSTAFGGDSTIGATDTCFTAEFLGTRPLLLGKKQK